MAGIGRQPDQLNCGVSVGTLPQVHFGGCTYCVHLNGCASFHAKEKGPTLFFPLCRAPTTLTEADRQVM